MSRDMLKYDPKHCERDRDRDRERERDRASSELDLHDPSTLNIHSYILLFEDDHTHDELAFF